MPQVPQTSVVTSSTAAVRNTAPWPSPSPSPSLVCTWKQGCYGAAWVHVVGVLDLATAPQLMQTLHEARLHAFLLVLDLRELTSMDSSGLHVILDAAGAARREGGRVMLVRGPANVDRMFTLTGASDQVMIFDLDPAEPDQALFDLPPASVAA